MWKNKKVWIVGASRGIGASLAHAFNERGAFTILSSRDSNQLIQLQKSLIQPEMSAILPLDLTDPLSISRAIAQFLDTWEHCDVMVHCGGISQRATSMETTIDTTRKIFESNFFGHIQLTQGMLPQMVSRKSGKLIVISSLSGKWGFYLRSSYSASKHALHGYYDSVRMETEKSGISIHLVTPGFIATDISLHAIDSSGESAGVMDKNQLTGISPDECARQIIIGVEKNKSEFGVGGKEMLSLFLNRYFPRFFQKLLRKQSAR
jgi:dehydrogenase/reductase SDR family member 7B